ncbi:MAG TPA: amidohydrolase family protein [Gemmatimonadaceae bacterium]|nr:amidohydrolase family protein [Gemmatimonadaceae bacterium]
MHFRLLLLLVFLVSSAEAQQRQRRQRAELILTGGKIFTSDFRRPYVQAIAIRGDKVMAVGSNVEIRLLAGPDTKEIPLAGRTVIPGLNDARVYIGASDVGELLRFRRDDPSVRDVLDAVRDAARRLPEGAWIRGALSPNALLDRGATRTALDRVSARNPVVLSSVSGHGVLLNSVALAELGMADTIPDPVGGWFERDSTGRITGFAYGYAQWSLERALAGRRSDSAFTALYRAYADNAMRLGFTSLQLVSKYQPSDAALRALVASQSPIRWRLIRFPMTDARGRVAEPRLTAPRPASLVTLSGTTWIVDGSIVERGSLLRAEYADRAGWFGRGFFGPDTVRAMVTEAFTSRDASLLRASGDSSIALVLSAMSDTATFQRWRARRLRLDDADGLLPDFILQSKRVGLAVVQNPARLTMTEIARRRLPRHVTPIWQPLKTLVRQGIPLGFGSDGELSPYRNMMSAVTHPTTPGEALTREQAVVAYTRGSAEVEGMDERKGTLMAGMLADLAVLSQDIFRVPLADLPKTEAVMVMVGGKIVYEK